MSFMFDIFSPFTQNNIFPIYLIITPSSQLSLPYIKVLKEPLSPSLKNFEVYAICLFFFSFHSLSACLTFLANINFVGNIPDRVFRFGVTWYTLRNWWSVWLSITSLFVFFKPLLKVSTKLSNWQGGHMFNDLNFTKFSEFIWSRLSFIIRYNDMPGEQACKKLIANLDVNFLCLCTSGNFEKWCPPPQANMNPQADLYNQHAIWTKDYQSLATVTT